MAVELLESQAGSLGGTYVSNGTINQDAMQRTFFCWGTFDDARVEIEYSPDGTNWFRDKTEESTFRESDLRTIRFAAGVHFRAAIVGASSTTLLNLWVF